MMMTDETKSLFPNESKSTSNTGFTKLFNAISSFFYSPPNIYNLIEKDDYETLQHVINKFKKTNDQQGLKNYLNQCDAYKQSPIYWAVNQQKIGCAQVLLENHADANFMESSSLGVTLIFMSTIYLKNVEMTALLLKHGADSSKSTRHNKVPSQIPIAQKIIEQAEKLNATTELNFVMTACNKKSS